VGLICVHISLRHPMADFLCFEQCGQPTGSCSNKQEQPAHHRQRLAGTLMSPSLRLDFC